MRRNDRFFPVPPSVLDLVLPDDGRTLTMEALSTEVGRIHCEVFVGDEDPALGVFSEWKDDPSVRRVALSNPYADLAEYESDDGTCMWSEWGGAQRISCPVAAEDHPDLNRLFVRVTIVDRSFEDAAARELLLAYGTAVAASPGCTGRA
ncbi:hypothetical protein NPS70_02490 [Streptomyces sp. C10-9-1]|uniref:hypothetical protein n=1 Tax=Streptomyces sp. C10-9-1 TaxID=1859285 RepID=UPI002111C388|nr:hypothetical protein [Streptomyces sp. C10-9-1]MCQ6552075.1 hypothetical protein [Streptomyces sp. C10-9-1]